MQLSIKNVDDKVFRAFKAESVREGINVGHALNLAMKVWLDKNRKTKYTTILNFKPKQWGKGTERTSEEIDAILYG